jgi:hypothetical protein
MALAGQARQPRRLYGREAEDQRKMALPAQGIPA